MRVDDGRMVSADEAREMSGETIDRRIQDLAHTVVVQAEQIERLDARDYMLSEQARQQAEQIAAARALAERWQSVAADLDESKVTPTIAAIFSTQAGCGDAILNALGASGE